MLGPLFHPVDGLPIAQSIVIKPARAKEFRAALSLIVKGHQLRRHALGIEEIKIIAETTQRFEAMTDEELIGCIISRLEEESSSSSAGVSADLLSRQYCQVIAGRGKNCA